MNSMDIAGLARVRFNLLSEFMDGAVYGLGVLHPPGALAYPLGGQYHVWVSHKVEQQGKFPMAQTDRPPAYFYLLLGWVYINISPPKRGGFHAGGIVIIVVLCISPQLSIGVVGNRRKRGLPRNTHICAQMHHAIHVLIRGAG